MPSFNAISTDHAMHRDSFLRQRKKPAADPRDLVSFCETVLEKPLTDWQKDFLKALDGRFLVDLRLRTDRRVLWPRHYEMTEEQFRREYLHEWPVEKPDAKA